MWRSTSAVHRRLDFSVIVVITLLSLLIFFPPISAQARPLFLPSVNVDGKLWWRIYLLTWGSPGRSPRTRPSVSPQISPVLGDSHVSATPRPPPPPPAVSPPIRPGRSGPQSLGNSRTSATPRPPPPPPNTSPPIIPVRSGSTSLGDSHPSATRRPPPPPPRVSPPSHQVVDPDGDIVMVSDPYRPARTPPPPPRVYPPTRPISSDIIRQTPPSGHPYY
ncbi:hypothetical protein MLD38_031568 [Melastoma candidum]|uniref:Uncharacterized protein n=1 Tax=Melastoma candidum TaxID=119954 RepID=A0ACB9MQM8_9MYRT|nr:hypothetical protein MLD38_031568 [Melastoma candidum]